MKRIKGINLGGWLMMEGYILGGPNIAECIIKKEFKKACGENELSKFTKAFYQNFIQKEDFKNIAATNAKWIRLPFNSRLIEEKPYSYSNSGTKIIKKALDWAKESGLKVILDLHAAPGSQNYDWHSDSKGIAEFWQKKTYRDRAVKIWEYLSDTFKNHPGLGGYDLLNEPVTEKRNLKLIKDYYLKARKIIRQNDKERLIFLEGNLWGQKIDFLKGLTADKTIISIHAYLPLDYTFNFSIGLSYPGRIENTYWNKSKIYKYLEPYADFARKNETGILVGEFGINWRGGFWGEKEYLKDILTAFDNYGFGYTYWTYKSIATPAFPEGLFRFTSNNNYTKREGPTYGWQNYKLYWQKEKEKIKKFWRTESFTPNKDILTIIKKHFGT